MVIYHRLPRCTCMLAIFVVLIHLSWAPRLQARFLILKQKFSEAVDSGDVNGALITLRKELAPLGVNEPDLRGLASCLLRRPGDATDERLGPEWRPHSRPSRAELMAALAARLPPALILPEARLEHLIEQALAAQVEHP